MTASLGRIVLYTKKQDAMIRFYADLFGYEAIHQEGDRIIELRPIATGCALLLHPASKGQREGQAQAKLVFDVEDVEGFCRRAAEDGYAFGATHKADGYTFANIKDPSKNSVSVSSRAYR